MPGLDDAVVWNYVCATEDVLSGTRRMLSSFNDMGLDPKEVVQNDGCSLTTAARCVKVSLKGLNVLANKSWEAWC